MTIFKRLLLPVGLFFLFASHLHAGPGDCLPDLGSGNICSASDFIITETVQSSPPACIEGELLDEPLVVRVGLQPTATQRYQIAAFIGDNGGSPIGGESCTFLPLVPVESPGNPFDPLSGHGPYRALDDNQCGDVQKSDGIVYLEASYDKILCRDSDSDGKLDIAYALSWQQQATPCDDPSDSANFYPPSASKCVKGIDNYGEIEVVPPLLVPAIELHKSVSPQVIEVPGGTVVYTVSVTNSGPVTVELTTLNDSNVPSASLNGMGTCSLPQVLASGETYSCSFPMELSAAGPGSIENTVTGSAVDNNGLPAEDNDNALVTFVASGVIGSIGNLVWNDLNADGLRSGDEPGISGAAVELYLDSGSGYALVETIITDGDGHYEFSELAAGSYRVVPDTSISPLNSMVHTGGIIPHSVLLGLDEHYMLADFGFTRAAITVSKDVSPKVITAPSATVDYRVTVTNSGPVTVTVTGLNDTVYGDLVDNGCALPQTLRPGDHYSCIFSKTVSGDPGTTHPNTVTALALDEENNAVVAADSAVVVIIDGASAAVGHEVWYDLNANGINEPGEPYLDYIPLALNGVETGSGLVVSQTTKTLNGGQYSFNGLAAGDYTVTVPPTPLLAGFILTTDNLPYNTDLAAGEIDDLADFGYARPEIAISKTADKTTIHAPSEEVVFTLVVSNPGPFDLTVTSLDDTVYGDLSGRCGLPRLLPASGSFTCLVPETVAGAPGTTHSNVVIVSGTDPAGNLVTAADGENIHIVDTPAGGSIGQFVWFDSNGDGIMDPGEPGIDGVTLDLVASSDPVTVLETITTANGGRYSFSRPVGTYNVVVTDVNNILSGLILTGGTNPHTDIVLTSGNYYIAANFGYYRAEIAISKSTDKTTIYAPGDEVIFSLEVSNPNPVALTVTGLEDTVYGDLSDQCGLPRELPADSSFTCTFSEYVGGEAGTYHSNTVTISGQDPGSNPVTDVDDAMVHIIAGIGGSGAIGQIVWLDLNANGIRESGEPGIDGVSLDLLDSSSKTVLATTTTASGGSYGFNVANGSFDVVVTDQANVLTGMVLTGGVNPHTGIAINNNIYIAANFGYARAEIEVIKTPDPSVVVDPGPGIDSTVSYTVTVNNTGPLDVDLESLADVPFGNIANSGNPLLESTTCSLPQLIAAGASYTCSFQAALSLHAGDPPHVNMITAGAADAEDNPVSDYDDATVTVIDGNNAAIGHYVWNDVNGDALYTPGETFFDNVTVELVSNDGSISRTSSTVGGYYSFLDLPGSHTYTVTVTDTNYVLNGYLVTTGSWSYTTPHVLAAGEVDANANFGFALAAIDVSKTADPSVIYAPGDNVTYTLLVTNPNPVVATNPGIFDLSVTGISDNTFTAVDFNAACGPFPRLLPAGQSFTCGFTENVSGSPGTVHTNVVTVVGEDLEHNQLVASDYEQVQIVSQIGGSGVIGWIVWYDIDADGVRDPEEPGIDGISLDLVDNSSGVVTASTTTAGGGQYGFNAVNGNYSVVVTDQAHILNGMTQTEGTNPHAGIQLSNQVYLAANFGYVFVDNPLPSVDLEKATNGEDADSPPGPEINRGRQVTWTYTVTNSGHFHLNNITVTDDQGVAVSCPKDNLAIGESMTCTGKGTAVKGQYENVGSVTAVSDYPAFPPTVDSDLSHYFSKGFIWIPPPPCATFPLHCYVIADRDTSGAQVDRLFKYTFRGNSLEYLNHLGVINVETMTLSLDGKTIYATDAGVLGTVDPTPGITDSFSPINSAGIGSANGANGTVVISDIDGLAIDPTTGIMYATERYKEEDPDVLDLLLQIDPASGTIVKDAFGAGKDYVIINTRAAGVKDADDIDIDASGQMYGVAGVSGGGGGDQGLLIDKETGAVIAYAALHDENGNPVQDMEGFTIYNHNHYYGTTGIEFTAQQTDNTLYKIDRKTGETKKIIRLDQAFEGFTPVDFEAISCFPVCGNK